MSSQEAALRILAFSFGVQLFKNSSHSNETRIHSINQTIFEHAKRIPPTLIYAQSQNNNHLLSEAAGLYTAGVLFKNTKKRSLLAKKLAGDYSIRDYINRYLMMVPTSRTVQTIIALMLHLSLWVLLHFKIK